MTVPAGDTTRRGYESLQVSCIHPSIHPSIYLCIHLSKSLRPHKSVTGVSRLPVLGCGTTFHLTKSLRPHKSLGSKLAVSMRTGSLSTSLSVGDRPSRRPALLPASGWRSADENGPPELSMGWVDPWVGSGWVEIFQFLVGWVGSATAKVLKIWTDYFNAFKAQLDKIWLNQAVKFDFMADLTDTGNWSEGIIKW